MRLFNGNVFNWSFFSLEHSKFGYYADFACYVTAIVVLAALLLLDRSSEGINVILGFTLIGLTGWTAIEYALHRFVLHGIRPFSDWHAAHHQRPTALICAPTILSAALIITLVFLPALLLSNAWRAGGLTLGVMIGYLMYSIVHHATHHWRSDSRWLKQRKRWHAFHHHQKPQSQTMICYGVTSAFWDYIFGSIPR